MKTRTKNLVIATATAGLMMAGSVHAQYYGQPLTGEGSTVQSSQQWQQQQRQWQAQNIQPRYNQFPTHTPSVTDRAGNQFMWRPEIGAWVPTQLSPQVINSIPSPSPIGCAFGANTGARFGGTPGAAVGCAAGAFGAPTSRIGAAARFFRPEQAY